MIKSAYNSDTEILHAINELYLKSKGFDLDPTFGKGTFYKHFLQPKIKGDLHPKFDDVQLLDTTQITNFVFGQRIKSIIFDPPFLWRTGSSDNNSHICSKYSYFPSREKLLDMYYRSICGFRDVLAPKGILVFKCQDASNGRQNYFIHVDICRMAEVAGFKPIDLFVKVNGGNIIKRSDSLKQGMARKNHSYFWVFRKI